MQARIESADLTDIRRAEYRADLVVVMEGDGEKYAIVVEVQLSRDERKRYAWPAYVSNLRARMECPVYLLVVTDSAAVARWAAAPIELGGGNTFVPQVLNICDINDTSIEELDLIGEHLLTATSVREALDRARADACSPDPAP
jgi:hypothetical protein